MSARAWSFWFAMSLLTAVGGGTGCGGGGVPVESPTTLSAGRTPEQTQQAILDALPKRSWTAEEVQPNRIVAFLAVRKHLLRIEIRFDAQQVSLYYVESDNLAAHVAGDGRVYAHPNVNRWIRNLASDISAAFAVAPQPGTAGGAVNEAPPPGAPPPPPPAETTPGPQATP